MPRAKHTGGFTIVETLVAIGILVAIIIGASSATQRALSSYIFSKDQIIAFYLAQEGFERIRNARDSNVLAGVSWLSGLSDTSSDPCYFGNACTVASFQSGAVRCPAIGLCPLLRQNATTGLINYDPASPVTIFDREIVFSPISSTEVALTVTVTWSKGGVSRSFKIRENLLNWQ
jgi:Tfp pilus assembly protein PilV